MKKKCAAKRQKSEAAISTGTMLDIFKERDLIDPVSLGFYDWRVVIRNQYRSEDGSEVLGETDVNNTKVYVDDAYPDQVIKETLMHELLHVCFAHSGLNLKDNLEEKIVQTLSPRIMELFTKNKHLKKYLFKSSDALGNKRKKADGS